MRVDGNLFQRMISPGGLFWAWQKFRKGKGRKQDVMAFEWNLERNIFALHDELATGAYRHGSYSSFFITDPKRRHIHKATVRDRVVHHAVFQALNPIFEPTFIADSFSCRVGKGTHKGVETLEQMTRQVSRNNTQPCFALKCDVRRFFDSVDHGVLVGMLERRIDDPQTIRLLRTIVESFLSDASNLFERRGLPIGNLTSQLLANIYMNVFDQFVKHELRVKHYVRYTDDFVVLSQDRHELEALLPTIRLFLRDRLRLELHPDKVSIGSLHEGIDFLGTVIHPHYRTLRTKTKRRLFARHDRRLTEYADRGGGQVKLWMLHCNQRLACSPM